MPSRRPGVPSAIPRAAPAEAGLAPALASSRRHFPPQTAPVGAGRVPALSYPKTAQVSRKFAICIWAGFCAIHPLVTGRLLGQKNGKFQQSDNFSDLGKVGRWPYAAVFTCGGREQPLKGPASSL